MKMENNIVCYVMTEEGSLKAIQMPKKLLLDLAINLREKGTETIHFAHSSLVVEGVFIPAKGTKHSIMALPNFKDDKDENLAD